MPGAAEDLKTKEFGGRLWFVSFRKPVQAKKPVATVTSLLERRYLRETEMKRL
ncbi:MAG TPA: hypothetical protein GX699_01190 [Firmicutes bacterium]|nr:hypothetical protein [Bacillota bacterium]